MPGDGPASATERFRAIVSGEARGAAASLARLALGALAVPYGLAVAARNRAFDFGLRRVHRAGRPVVSVGNITAGGVGKTPFVAWLAQRFINRGRRVALLSRGYGASAGPNDEARVLTDLLPSTPHYQGADRVALARQAESSADVLLLDDGFQHRRLGRDLDIVLIDATTPFGYGRLLPRGLLREPIGSLSRANLIVLTRVDLITDDDRRVIRRQVRLVAPHAAWAEVAFRPTTLRSAAGTTAPAATLIGRRVAAFCGIGNPEGFRRTLAGLGAEIVSFRAFPDHHAYSDDDARELGRWADSIDADIVVGTHKDLVKLPHSRLGATDFRAVAIETEVVGGADAIEASLSRIGV